MNKFSRERLPQSMQMTVQDGRLRLRSEPYNQSGWRCERASVVANAEQYLRGSPAGSGGVKTEGAGTGSGGMVRDALPLFPPLSSVWLSICHE